MATVHKKQEQIKGKSAMSCRKWFRAPQHRLHKSPELLYNPYSLRWCIDSGGGVCCLNTSLQTRQRWSVKSWVTEGHCVWHIIFILIEWFTEPVCPLDGGRVTRDNTLLIRIGMFESFRWYDHSGSSIDQTVWYKDLNILLTLEDLHVIWNVSVFGI